MLKDKIKDDLRQAMKSGDAARVSILRLLQTAILNKEIEKHGRGAGDTLTEDEVTQILMTEAKKHKESISIFEQGGRKDLSDKEKTELDIIQKYLPQQLSLDELKSIVKAIIQRAGTKEFGTIMKEVMKETKGRADGALVSQIVKEFLQ